MSEAAARARRATPCPRGERVAAKAQADVPAEHGVGVASSQRGRSIATSPPRAAPIAAPSGRSIPTRASGRRARSAGRAVPARSPRRARPTAPVHPTRRRAGASAARPRSARRRSAAKATISTREYCMNATSDLSAPYASPASPSRSPRPATYRRRPWRRDQAQAAHDPADAGGAHERHADGGARRAKASWLNLASIAGAWTAATSAPITACAPRYDHRGTSRSRRSRRARCPRSSAR